MKATDISLEARLEEQTALLKEIKKLLLSAEFEGVPVFFNAAKEAFFIPANKDEESRRTK